MISLKISNASEVVASKLGKFLQALTPEALDQASVEDVLLKKLIEKKLSLLAMEWKPISKVQMILILTAFWYWVEF